METTDAIKNLKVIIRSLDHSKEEDTVYQKGLADIIYYLEIIDLSLLKGHKILHSLAKKLTPELIYMYEVVIIKKLKDFILEQDDYGITPLHIACREDKYKMVSLMLYLLIRDGKNPF